MLFFRLLAQNLKKSPPVPVGMVVAKPEVDGGMEVVVTRDGRTAARNNILDLEVVVVVAAALRATDTIKVSVFLLVCIFFGSMLIDRFFKVIEQSTNVLQRLERVCGGVQMG